jgi:3-hydroxybutyryl-CoA dehydrogenase
LSFQLLDALGRKPAREITAALKSGRHREIVEVLEAIDTSMRLTLGRRYSETGPIESAELGGLDIIHMFAEFLFPSLNTDKEPPKAVTELVKHGCFGLKAGKGIYDWSKRDGKALQAKRADRLFQHMSEDARDR